MNMGYFCSKYMSKIFIKDYVIIEDQDYQLNYLDCLFQEISLIISGVKEKFIKVY